MDQLLSGVAGAGHHCVSASIRRDRWWRRVRQNVPRQADCLLDLVNASFEGVPDFLCADAESGHRRLADELDAMIAVPESRIRQDLAFYGDGPELPRIVRELREGGTRRLRQIAEGAWALFRSCLIPDWPDIQRLLEADVAHHSRAVGEAGTGAMLAQLHPQASWQTDGVLRLAAPGWAHSFALGGRGLELRPNIFLTSIAASPAEHRAAAAMMYPIPVRRAEYASAPGADGLAGLVGSTRARALRAISLGPCTTTELSERLGLSPASASAHATALRVAGVISTEREGRQVRHALTLLGHDLLLYSPGRPATDSAICAAGRSPA
ncbi:ArsR/SmtB family transcription factor [Kitasatospora sp. NPDC008050]|uniref:ArsR/SmtB family transcription factor n=1 Tax=Kitasatospora sp. NPDC008050 TaxID=3364021 RepID=UPI0036E23012